jgi:RHS repeat-associated protein
LKLRNFYSSSCNSANIRANAISDTWNKETLTWANQPDVYSGSFDDYATAYGATGCPEAGWAQWNVIDMVRNWTDGTWTNRGIRLKAIDETNNASWRKYRSANYNTTTSYRPTLEVTYNNYPNKASIPAVSPGNAGYATTTTPTLKSTLTDPDGGELRAKFTVTDSAGTEVWTGYSCASLDTEKCTSSGGVASKTVPASANLVHGSTYTVKAWAQDASGVLSKNAATSTLKVDTIIPGVNVTATGFTEDMWAPSKPASNKFILTGSTDTTSFEVLKDDTSITVAADSAGDGSLDWNVDAGWHKLTVIPHDKAGNAPNAEDATTFEFGVQKPAFDGGHDGQGSLGVFRLNPQAPSGATSMSLQWRETGDTDWHTAAGVTTAGGAAWANSTSDAGKLSTPGQLWWDASQQTHPVTGQKLTAPRLLQVRACFTYPTETVCSDPLLQQLDDGFGAQYPTTDLGPATVALANGNLSLPAADAATGGVALGRVWSTGQAATGTDGPFGRGWESAAIGGGASDTTVIDNTAVDGSFVLVYPDGGNEKFVKTGTSEDTEIYTPVDTTNTYTRLEMTPADPPDTPDAPETPDTLTLIEDADTTTETITTWQREPGSSAWVLKSVNAPGTGTDAAVDVEVSGPRPNITWISQVAAGAADTCTAVTQSEGCRGLQLDYDAAGHVTTITRKIRDLGSAATTEKVVATFSYANSLLTKACGLDPDHIDGTNGPLTPLCVSYGYDTTGPTPRLTSVTEPGLTPWRYTYDTAGRVSGVKRTMPGGTGDASWAIDYNLGLSAAGLPDMSPAAAAQWGQTTAPAHVYAVYVPQADGDASTTDPTKAQLYYTDVDGVVTNTAVYGPAGWLVDTSWFDEYGNIVQSLDGAGWKRVQAAPVADRPAVARDASAFAVYNDDGDEDPADGDGTRIEEEYGPVTTATLEDGTTGPFRDHTSYVYDDEAPTLGGPKPANAAGAFDLVVEETHAASEPDMSGVDHDITLTRYEYDPVVAGDGNGWNLRLPTRTRTQLDDGTWSTAITRYDGDGNVIESRQPGGAAAADGSGSDAHSLRTIYYTSGTNAQDAECGNKPGWDGLVCKTKPAAQPGGRPMPTTWTKSYTTDLMPEVVEEISGAMVRTTTTGYDQLARPTSVEVMVRTNGAPDGPDLPVRTISYNDQGQQASVTAGGKTITTTYDAWGRESGYTDALGNHATTNYNPAGQVATVDDGAGTYTYSYTARGQLSSIDAGGGVGSFTYAYTADGQIDTVTYPNGLVADYDHNEAGAATGLTYSQGSVDLLSFGATVDIAGRTTASSSTASEQHYTYDALGRLTKTEDIRDGGCTTRTYGFDASSNRTSYATYNPDAATGDCQTTTAAVSEANSFDTAGRIINTGYSYDNLGRATTIPKADTTAGATGDLTATYHANDMVASLSQTIDNGAGGSSATTTNYDLDPVERVSTITKRVNGAETSRTRYRFANSSDSPSVVEASTDAGASWTTTRYTSLPGIGMVASTTAGTTTLQLANLHGDTVATMANTTGATGIDTYTETDEYGNSISTGSQQQQRYGWLGSHLRSTDTVGGIMLMGARLYNPTTGAFTSQDPVYGGNNTAYTYPQDPVNDLDLDGLFSRHVRIAMRFFISLPRYGVRDAAAIVGNLRAESGLGLDPTARNPSTGNLGIAQWDDTRFGRLSRFAENQNRSPFNFRIQLRFVVRELNGRFRSARRHLLNARTRFRKTRIIQDEYEICFHTSPGCSSRVRQRFARRLVARFR